MTNRARIQTTEEEGLFSVLQAAGRAVAGPLNDTVGEVEILPEPTPGTDHGAPLAIEAAYAIQDGQRVVYRLDVRSGAVLDTDATLELARDALAHFGGTHYTNFCLVRPATGEILDVTTYFPSRIGFYARNIALVADPLDPALRPGVAQLLDALGVRHSARGETLRVPAHQLRGALTRDQQLDALRFALTLDLSVTLYASALPTTQAVRVQATRAAGRDDTSKKFVECCLSRGLHAAHACTLTDAEEMEQLLQRHFDVRFSARGFSVASTQRA